MAVEHPDDKPYSHACRKCGRLIAPGFPLCMQCRDERLRLWKRDREHLIHAFNRQLEGGRPFFIAGGTIMLGVLVYLLLLA